MSKRKKMVLAIGAALLLIGLWFGFLAITGNLKSAPPSTPAMPENQTKNTTIEKALEQKTAIQNLDRLVDELRNQNIRIQPSFQMDKNAVVAFINELKSDQESQKIFRQYGQAGITIFLSNKYEIYDGGVFIYIRKGVKKAAKWLETGEVK